MPYVKNYTIPDGAKQGRLLLLNQFKSEKGYMVNCLCSCGKETTIYRSSFVSGKTKSCGCLYIETAKLNGKMHSAPKRLAKGEANFNALYKSYARGAKRRNLIFDLNKERFKELTLATCYYCGSSPTSKANNSSTFNGVYLYNGIDRVDSKNGYTADNCVACCKTCNVMKWNLPKDMFLQHITKIYNYKGLKH